MAQQPSERPDRRIEIGDRTATTTTTTTTTVTQPGHWWVVAALAIIGAFITIGFLVWVLTPRGDGGNGKPLSNVVEVLPNSPSVLNSKDGAVDVDVPAGAVNVASQLTYGPRSPSDIGILPDGFTAGDTAFDLFLDTVLLKPITVKVRVTPADMGRAGNQGGNIVIQHFRDRAWIELDTQVNSAALIATVRVDSLSMFALTIRDRADVDPLGLGFANLATPEELPIGQSVSVTVGVGLREPIASVDPDFAMRQALKSQVLTQVLSAKSPKLVLTRFEDVPVYDVMSVKLEGQAFEFAERDWNEQKLVGNIATWSWNITPKEQFLGPQQIAVQLRAYGRIYRTFIAEIIIAPKVAPVAPPTDVPTPTPVPTVTPVPSPSPTPPPTQAAKPTLVPEPTTGPTPGEPPTATPAPTASPVPTVTPRPTPTRRPTLTPTATPRPMPTITPTPTPTPVLRFRLVVGGRAVYADEDFITLSAALVRVSPAPEDDGAYPANTVVKLVGLPREAGTEVIWSGVDSQQAGTAFVQMYADRSVDLRARPEGIRPTRTPRPAATATPVPTAVPTATPGSVPTSTPQPTPTPTPGFGSTPVPTTTPTATPFPTPQPTPTASPTPTPSGTPTPTPTPTSGKIVYFTNRDGNGEIYVMDEDGSNETRLTLNSTLDAYPSWSPNGLKIVYMGQPGANQEICVMNADGSNVVRLTNNNAEDWWPTFSPDGQKIAFTTDRDGNREIYVMNADGTGQSNITNDPTEDDNANWGSNDKIVWGSRLGGGETDIYSMNSDGTGVTRLTTDPAADYKPAWSPDGAQIVFIRGGGTGAEIYTMQANGSQQTRITNNAAAEGDVVWSPTGTKIAFSRGGGNAVEIYNVNSDGSGEVQLTNNSSQESVGGWKP